MFHFGFQEILALPVQHLLLDEVEPEVEVEETESRLEWV